MLPATPPMPIPRRTRPQPLPAFAQGQPRPSLTCGQRYSRFLTKFARASSSSASSGPLQQRAVRYSLTILFGPMCAQWGTVEATLHAHMQAVDGTSATTCSQPALSPGPHLLPYG